jgi:hypothetical protein
LGERGRGGEGEERERSVGWEGDCRGVGILLLVQKYENFELLKIHNELFEDTQ